jgi:hypothetical protein
VHTQLCDRGTLEDALARGLSPAGHRDACAAGPWAVGALLLDVAAALQYLHSIRLVRAAVMQRRSLLGLSDGPAARTWCLCVPSSVRQGERLCLKCKTRWRWSARPLSAPWHES